MSPKPAPTNADSSKKGSKGGSSGSRTSNKAGKSTGNSGNNKAKSPKPSTPAPSLTAIVGAAKSAAKPSGPSQSSTSTVNPPGHGRDAGDLNEKTPRPSPSIPLQSPQSEQATGTKKTSKVCPHFRRGSCWKGEICTYVHSREDVVASPAPSTLSELVMSPPVNFDKFTLKSESDTKGKASTAGASSKSGGLSSSLQQTLVGSIRERTAAPSTAPPSSVPQTPSLQFTSVSSFSYDSDEEEERVMLRSKRSTPQVPAKPPTFAVITPYISPEPSFGGRSSPLPEVAEAEAEESPASSQTTPSQKPFELMEESADPAIGSSGDFDLPRDEEGAACHSGGPGVIPLTNGNSSPMVDAGMEETQPVEPLEDESSPDALVAEQEYGHENSEGEEVAEALDKDRVNEKDTRDVNDFDITGPSSSFDWSAEVEQNGDFAGDNDESESVIDNAANETITASSTPSLDEEGSTTTFHDELPINDKPSNENTKLDSGGEESLREGPLDDSCVPDEHEIDQWTSPEKFDQSENEATQHDSPSHFVGTQVSSKTSPFFQQGDIPYIPPTSPSFAKDQLLHRSRDSTPTIPSFTPPVIPSIGTQQISPPIPQVAVSPPVMYAQHSDSVDATATKVNQLQVANTATVLPQSTFTSVAVAQPTLPQQPVNTISQPQPLPYPQQVGNQPFQVPQIQPQVVPQQVNIPANYAQPFNLQYPFLQIPQLQPSFGFQPLVTPVVMQPIIQQQPILTPYTQINPMYNSTLSPYTQSFDPRIGQQQQQQQVPHWTQFADPQARSDIPFCKLLAQGNCPSGNICTYRHALTIQEFTLLFHDRQPALFTINQTHPWHRQVSQPPQGPSPQVLNYSQSFSQTAMHSIASIGQADPQKVTDQSTITQPPKSQVCHFYPLNRCTNGDNCPYLHVQPDSNPSQLSSSTSRPAWGKTGATTSRSHVPCKFFFSANRRCDNIQCSFSHDKADAPNAIVDAQSSTAAENVEEKADDGGWGSPTNWEQSGWGVLPEELNKADDIEAWGMPSTQKPSESSANKPEPARKSSKSEYINGKKRCLHFQRGSCWKGDNCKFAHDGEPTGDSSSAPSPRVEPAQTGTPRSQTSSELRTRTVVDVNNTNHGNNLDNFGQATLNEDANQDATWAAQDDDVDERDDGIEDKDAVPSTPLDDDFVEEDKWNDDNFEPENEQESTDVENNNTDDHDDATGRVEDEVDDEPIVFLHPDRSYTLWNCGVRFAPDITPDTVTTSAESRTIIISNVPRGTAITDVRRLASDHGEVKDVSVAEDFASSTSIRVEFADVNQAIRAFTRLDGQKFKDRQLGVSLKSLSPVTSKVSTLRCSIKVSWPLPSVTAFCYYPTITAAKQEADRLNGTEIKGRCVTATFDSPRKNKKDDFVVTISDLPPDILESDLKAVCQGSSLIVPSSPSYEGDVSEDVKLLCHDCGGMDSFEVFPMSSTQKRFTAFATYVSEAAADHAIKRLHGVNQKLLQDKPLQVRAMYYARYRVEEPRFKVLEKTLTGIQSKTECQLHWIHCEGKAVILRILAPGDKGSSFQEVCAEVVRLLAGRVVCDDETQKPLWHDYFDTSSSAKLLARLSDDYPVLIHCDRHSRHLKVFGAPEVQEQVQLKILKTLEKPIRTMTQKFSVSKPQIGALINGLLEKLQGREEMGSSKLVLDAAEGVLTLWGGKANNAAEIVTSALKVADVQLPAADASHAKSRCQLPDLRCPQHDPNSHPMPWQG
ncbi:hypothetical protein CVT24_002764 [Panaeolus cyanescens]|uniref:Uncharacterized protein n=1 Tax=Panaeolus cyanescens TaxID=181874 RepID=A0A409VNA0_9AGAR|nr:hypothetical protein CVT24_002764 [Panaeolus cyanescens]